MEHREIEDNDLIDKYLLHQLTEEEESNFEEHLLFCDDCQKNLDIRKVSIGLIRENQLNNEKRDFNIEKKSNEKKTIKYLFALKVAASIIILLSILLIINRLTESGVNGKKISLRPFTNDSAHSGRNPVFEENTQSSNNNQLAQAFKEMPEFENFIKNNSSRAENITVLLPKSVKKVKLNELITINWALQNTDSLNFVIFNNKGKLIFENKIPPRFQYKQKLEPGLYYWQLETDEEALYTGKFIVEY